MSDKKIPEGTYMCPNTNRLKWLGAEIYAKPTGEVPNGWFLCPKEKILKRKPKAKEPDPKSFKSLAFPKEILEEAQKKETHAEKMEVLYGYAIDHCPNVDVLLKISRELMQYLKPKKQQVESSESRDITVRVVSDNIEFPQTEFTRKLLENDGNVN